MEEVVVRTDIYAPPDEVFAFLRSFTNYAEYSEYLTDVSAFGDGGPGTQYELTASWWRINYRARTEVTAIDPPERIAWRVVDVIDADGIWQLEPIENGTRVTLRIAFDASTADRGAVRLPRFVSIGWVIDRVSPLVHREAEAIVKRIVTDLEGAPRDVDLEITVDRAA